MYSLNEYNENLTKIQQLNSTNEVEDNIKNTSSIIKELSHENKRKSILKSISTITNEEKENIILPSLENHKLTRIRAFEILSQLRHIKGLENLEEKYFLDLTTTSSKESQLYKNKIKKNLKNNSKNKYKNEKQIKSSVKSNNKENENINIEFKKNNENKINCIVENKEDNDLILTPKLMEIMLNLFSTLFWKLNIKSFQSLKEEIKNKKVNI